MTSINNVNKHTRISYQCFKLLLDFHLPTSFLVCGGPRIELNLAIAFFRERRELVGKYAHRQHAVPRVRHFRIYLRRFSINKLVGEMGLPKGARICKMNTKSNSLN
jgi:hypothetical protein